MSAPKNLKQNEIVILDYGTFENIRFENCELVYRGGRPPELVNNDFFNCKWTFDGEAANTAAFMKALYQGGGRNLVLRTIGAKDEQ